ncbi:MAG: hemerythrin domain-containing protein [Jiangellaceae bacterium]
MCSYCGCRSISVIAQFSAEHDDIVNATGALRRAADEGATALARQRVIDLFAILDPHTDAEERGLFHELRQDAEFTEYVDALCLEHHDLHARLRAIADGDFAAIGKFEHLIRHHIDREDNGLFPAAAVALDGPAWERVIQRT